MITAVASSGKSLNSKLDTHFGRCAYFMFYDTKTNQYEFCENPYKNSEHAGSLVVAYLQKQKVKQVISVEVGQKVKMILEGKKIQIVIINNADTTVNEIIKLFKNKELNCKE